MAKHNNRWMTWVLKDSAKTHITMPWARGTRPDWKENLAIEMPDLAKVLDHGMAVAQRTKPYAQHATS